MNMKKNMEKAKLLLSNSIKEYIEKTLKDNLQNFELVNGGQQRTVGDIIESQVVQIMLNSNNDLISETRKARSKKSIEDVTIISKDETFYIDPKTHDVNSKFSMPNMTSINKIRKLFVSDDKELIYVFVDYEIQDRIVMITTIKVFYIWELDISILSIGALGNGQLQIKNANKELIFTNKEKHDWYLDLKKLVQEYLKKQLKKIEKQIIEWQ
jgi:hypothetical protein